MNPNRSSINDTEHEPGRKNRSHWIGIGLLIPTLVFWIYILRESIRDEQWMAFDVPVAVIIALVSYCVHRFLWKWWGAVLVASVTLHFLFLTPLMMLIGEASTLEVLDAWGTILHFPMDSIWWTMTHLDKATPSSLVPSFFIAASLLCALVHPIFALTHPRFPSICTTMITTIGVNLYLLISVLMMSRAA